ncbi:regulatory protein ToxS [Vibrio sp. TH_r3]|uniref:regulatory protein ToxS n=1 Tax=Vibrio sp. TH_r3 TaxID=3082084 RepID=UPI002953A321|nr:regulatory protein ToxS [Vibrio sp. TH_r3]MDV7104074.1 regulatory protein ToxS [Vibrio sp. TH_r3]
MNNTKYALIILSISIMFSTWLYWGSDLRLEKELTSREWQSTIDNFISPEMQKDENNKIYILSNIEMISNVKYLPNGSYLRVSHLKMFDKNQQVTSVMNILESGDWELSDNYLLINPKDFKETSTNNSVEFTEQQLDIVKTLFIMDAEQSRRVDIINHKALLLTSLNQGSRILSSQ